AGIDVLLIDDVQFVASRRDAQTELLRVVSESRAAGRQLVVTSDHAPGEIGGMDARLTSELTGGLVVDVARPDFETRLGILARRGEERGAEFAPGVLEAAAKVEVANVRELIGALNRLVAFQAVSETPVTPAAATVQRTVEVWKARVGEAILRFEGEGYQTSRLGALLDQGTPGEAEATVQQFEQDVERLRSFATEMATLDPGAAGDSVFRDPDRV